MVRQYNVFADKSPETCVKLLNVVQTQDEVGQKNLIRRLSGLDKMCDLDL